MKKGQKWIGIFLFGLAACIYACVTVNIYFPAEKVESVASEIVKDVRGEKGSPSTQDKSSRLRKRFQVFSPSSAWAQDMTTVSNPTIRALKDKLRNNYRQMKPFYDKGMVKEGNDGYITVNQTDGLSLKDRRELNSLVDAENQHRRQLYGEVARALNIDSSQTNKVAEVFAKEWQKSARQ
ncbi:MAG: DUF1318 domain-containing protein [Deltaproteobacteria bacterium]|nr:DUF1318 domain-containing protein [Deltaproteobacteria bacterium]